MDLEYGTLLSPNPIKLSFGTLRQPTLNEIDSEITIPQFAIFESFLKMTPKLYYTKALENSGGCEMWENFSEDEQDSMTMYDVIKSDKKVEITYLAILNFFFVERIKYLDGYFFSIKPGVDANKKLEDMSKNDVQAVINEDVFFEVIDVIQQTCCIRDKKTTEKPPKYKNSKAKKIYEKMLKAMKEQEERESKKNGLNFSLANIISAVSNKHPTISPVNVWDLTVFQLYDAFSRLQINNLYQIDCMRVSTWGDEKKTFDISLWYKNNFDKPQG